MYEKVRLEESKWDVRFPSFTLQEKTVSFQKYAGDRKPDFIASTD